MATEQDAASAILDLATGRWRSQVLHAGVALGVYDALSASQALPAKTIAAEIGADEASLYRLLRASASLGLLVEEEDARFRLSPTGQLLSTDHPQSLRSAVLLEEGPVHYAIWRHLPALVREGKGDGFRREFGDTVFDHARKDPAYAKAFQDAMTSYSRMEAEALRTPLEGRYAGPKLFCDVGGGHGYLLAVLLRERPQAKGIVFDLPDVIATRDVEIAAKDGLADRISYQGGDMFDAIPEADIYLMKHILHDWSDDECRRILRVARESAPDDARLLLMEWVVPNSNEPHFAKLLDIHMLCASSGRERTLAEYEMIGADSGWHVAGVLDVPHSPLAIVELKPA